MQAPSKRLILCFDGTWNAIADPNIVTNVVKIANSVGLQDPSGINQICYYNSGVGSGGPIDRFMGGVFGAGLKSNVKRAIAFLALNYRTGDEIYLFGFSRGAYTARAVAGVLGVAGIPKEIRDAEVHWERYRQMAKLQSKQRDLRPDSKKYIKLQKQIEDLRSAKDRPTNYEPGEITITCVGVFDTVGSYGVPAGFGLSGLPHLFTYWTRGFHSRKFGSQVRVGLHAMAIDEMRRPFEPTFWLQKEDERLEQGQVVEQVWFPGVHSKRRRRLRQQRSVRPGVGLDDLARPGAHRAALRRGRAPRAGLAVHGRHALPVEQRRLVQPGPQRPACSGRRHRVGFDREGGHGELQAALARQRGRALERPGPRGAGRHAGRRRGRAEIRARQLESRQILGSERPRDKAVQPRPEVAGREMSAREAETALRVQVAAAGSRCAGWGSQLRRPSLAGAAR
jgi:hypothetical protein